MKTSPISLRLRSRVLLLLAGAMTFLTIECAIGEPAACASGIIKHAMTGVMYRQVFLMKANQEYLFVADNLSPGSDTILHVLSYPSGAFIAGNDDSTDSLSPHGSAVRIQPANVDRTVYLVVRAKPGTPDGTGVFYIARFDSEGFLTLFHFPMSFSAGVVENVGTLKAGTHITTVEENLGTLDTIAMVVGGDPSVTLGFDDNDGIDRMSFLRLSSACTSNCQIVVGTPQPSIQIAFFNENEPPGPVTVVWDETVETHDSDRDGLSDELEQLIFTNPSSGDSDGDGIPDAWEVYGAQYKTSALQGAGKNGNLMKFPKYGANPSAQDVFVEVDWVPGCPSGDPTCTPAIKDSRRIANAASASAVLDLAAGAMSGAVQAHFDVGIPTPGSDAVAVTDTIYGDWGGASRLSDDQTTFSSRTPDGNYTATVSPDTFLGFTIDQDCFTGSIQARQGTFHHLIISDDHTTGRLPTFEQTLFESAACAFVHVNDGSIAHELGHNFNLHHGGFPSAPDADINCKMNYASVMSYPNQGTDPFAPGYSFGRYQPLVLNGFGMNESAGLGISPVLEAQILNVFNGGPIARGFVDASTGGIDWNMDGRIEPGFVRAPTNWATNTCAAPYLRANWGVASVFGAAFPTLGIAEALSASPQIYAILPGARGGYTIAVGQGDYIKCVGSSGLGACTTWKWSSQAAVGVPASAVAVAGGMVVYRDTSGHIAYQRAAHVSSTPVGPGLVIPVVQAAQAGEVGGPVATGDPAAIEVDGHIRVYTPSSGNLRRWEFDETSGTWIAEGADELWDDGTPIHTSLGISIVHGATRPAGEGIFAAIPNADLAPAGQPMPIEFARLQSTNQVVQVTVPKLNLGFFVLPSFTYSFTVRIDRWHRLTPAGALGTAQFSRPGLAYVPFDIFSAPDDGRFYATFVPGGNGFQAKTARIVFTQGNDTSPGATSRALMWLPGQLTTFADDNNQDRDFSRGVVLGRFGVSVVGASSGSATGFSLGTNYFPAADGIVLADVSDYPDDLLVRHNLACSVHGDECDDSP
jgi:hypothetical protein